MNLSEKIIQWQAHHGRHHLPWQQTSNPYHVWLSEIMLQQTQVQTVLEYYKRFLNAFPNINDLAEANEDHVMTLWAGLGYYARARNLHQCAKKIVSEWEGVFPQDPKDLASLPGIGPSTASAIAAFSFGIRSPILDGNVKRVFARHFAIEGDVTKTSIEKTLWALAYEQLPEPSPDIHLRMKRYTQGLMDLGATICKKANPECERCPISQTCVALKEGRQHELPAPKTRKQLPTKQTCMIVLINNHSQVMLEKRPSPGIWGGLWSLPESSPDELKHRVQALGGSLETLRAHSQLKHTFSHHHLAIEVWACSMKSHVLQEANRTWIEPKQVLNVGVPKPVSRILQSLSTSLI